MESWEWSRADFYQHEQERCGDSKSEEEISKYTLREGLSVIQRSEELLLKGESLQKIAVVRSLPSLVRDKYTEEKVLSLVVKQLDHEEPAVQAETGYAFLKMLQLKSCGSFENQRFLLDIFDLNLNMMKVQSTLVVDSWVELMRELLKSLQFENVSKILISEIFDLSGVASPTINKYAAMKMLGASIARMGKEGLSDSLIALVKLFSSVSDTSIKGCVVSEIWMQLFPLLSQAALEAEWLPMVVNTIEDPQMTKDIRSSAITTLAQTLEQFSDDSKQKIILPLLIRLISGQLEQPMLLAISKQLGPFCFHLKDILDDAVINFVFQQLENPSIDIRINAVFNYPAFFIAFNKKYKDKLLKSYVHALTKDDEDKIKVQSAKELGEIGRLIGPENTRTYLKGPLRIAYSDKEKPEVRLEAIKCVPELLGLLGTEAMEILSELVNIFDAQIRSPAWRVAEKLLALLIDYVELFLSGRNDILEKFTSSLFKCASEGNFELKISAARALASLVQAQQSNQVRQLLIAQAGARLLNGRVYHQRLAYLEFVDCCLEKLGRSFFRQQKLIQCMDLCSDKVPNVRKKLASMIVKIRGALLKSDTQSIELFDSLFIHLLSDSDRETSRIAQESHQIIHSKQFLSDQKSKGEEEIKTEGEETKSHFRLSRGSFQIQDQHKQLAIPKNRFSFRSFDSSEKTYLDQNDQLTGLNQAAKKNFNVKKIPWKPQKVASSPSTATEPIIAEPKQIAKSQNNILPYPQQQQQQQSAHLLVVPANKSRRNSSSTTAAERQPRNIVSAQIAHNNDKQLKIIQEYQCNSSQQQHYQQLNSQLSLLKPLAFMQQINGQTSERVTITQDLINHSHIPIPNHSSFINGSNKAPSSARRERSSHSLNKPNNLKPLPNVINLKNNSSNKPSKNSQQQSPPMILITQDPSMREKQPTFISQEDSKSKYSVNSEKRIGSQHSDRMSLQTERIPMSFQNNAHSHNLYRIKKQQIPISPSAGLPPRFFPKKPPEI